MMAAPRCASREICFGSFLRPNAASRTLGGQPTAGAVSRGGVGAGVGGLRAQEVVATGQLNVRASSTE